jgi:multidrug resistance efflux pump
VDDLGEVFREVASGKRKPARRWAVTAVKQLATLGVALVAIVMALVTWDYYVTASWTRDGRVRVQVASVAPQVSGQITELKVGDSQFVHQGDVLYVIDPFDFEVAFVQISTSSPISTTCPVGTPK